ncbi:MAG TPA: enoyl-CoA hydratase/isomerase family protein [Candidatus Acidoferrales bacterium]|nr:enoyl-CoA hydratase/isomerase family protein [Candidatus Acidoferrales bacterium]
MSNEIQELVLSAPGRNALSSEFMQRLIDELRNAAGKPLLLSGANGAFSAGLNLKEVASLDLNGMTRFLGLLDELIDALYLYPGPTVACVNGHAIAGGCMLVLCCDLRIAVDDDRVRIGLNEVPLGLEFPPKLLALAVDRVAPRSRDRVLLEGGLHDPRTALQLGLIDEVAGDVHATGRAAIERFAASPRAEYIATKNALRTGKLDLSSDQQRYFREHIVPTWCSEAVKERARARLQSKS